MQIKERPTDSLEDDFRALNDKLREMQELLDATARIIPHEKPEEHSHSWNARAWCIFHTFRMSVSEYQRQLILELLTRTDSAEPLNVQEYRLNTTVPLHQNDARLVYDVDGVA